MKKFFYNFPGLVFVVFSFIILTAFFVFMNLIIPASSEEKWKEVHIPEGSTYSNAITILQRESIISNRFALIVVGWLVIQTAIRADI
jgi:cell division protein YceG involved in septum cleavage